MRRKICLLWSEESWYVICWCIYLWCEQTDQPYHERKIGCESSALLAWVLTLFFMESRWQAPWCRATLFCLSSTSTEEIKRKSTTKPQAPCSDPRFGDVWQRCVCRWHKNLCALPCGSVARRRNGKDNQRERERNNTSLFRPRDSVCLRESWRTSMASDWNGVFFVLWKKLRAITATSKFSFHPSSWKKKSILLN